MIERTEPNHFNYTYVSYGLDANGDIVYIHQTSGWFQFLDINTIQVFGSRGYYTPWQDPYGEEDPEYGCYSNVGVTFHRVPIVDPCIWWYDEICSRFRFRCELSGYLNNNVQQPGLFRDPAFYSRIFNYWFH